MGMSSVFAHRMAEDEGPGPAAALRRRVAGGVAKELLKAVRGRWVDLFGYGAVSIHLSGFGRYGNDGRDMLWRVSTIAQLDDGMLSHDQRLGDVHERVCFSIGECAEEGLTCRENESRWNHHNVQIAAILRVQQGV